MNGLCASLLRSRRAEYRSDLFSLGSLMYFISTGKEPFRASSAFGVISKITRNNPKPANQVNVDIPETLNRVIERLLEKKPDERIESAEHLEKILTNLLAHLQDPKQYAIPSVRPTSMERRRNRN